MQPRTVASGPAGFGGLAPRVGRGGGRGGSDAPRRQRGVGWELCAGEALQ